MATTFTFYWNQSPRIIEVNAPTTEITVQELVNAVRSEEGELNNLDDPPLISATGKDSLGGGVTTGIVCVLYNTKIRFANRPGPDVIQCSVKGGTVVCSDESNPITPSTYTYVVILNQIGGTIATSSGDVTAIANGVWDKVAVGSAPNSYGEKVIKTNNNASLIPAAI